jgi:peptide/nickel transport system substrate-binding protein
MSHVARRWLALAATAVIVASACGGTAATQAPTSQAPGGTTAPAQSAAASPAVSSVDLISKSYKPEPAAKTGGTVVLAEWQFPDSIMAYYTQSVTSFEALYPAFDGLWRVAPDFKWYPDLTKDVPLVSNGGVVVNGDKMDVKVNLKDGIKWSDGQPITCDDVIATWHWIMDKDQVGLTGGTIGWEDIGSIDGAGTNTCVIHFNKVYEGYLGLIDPVLPAHYISTVSVTDAPKKLYSFDNVKAGVYSGPYIPVEVKTNAQITYAPNPNWAAIGGHAPYLDKLIFKYYGDADAMVAGYRAGEYDVANDLNHADIPKVQDLGSQMVALEGLIYELNQLNNASLAKKFGAGDVLTIKQAIRLAYNKSEITDRILGGTVKPSNNFLSPLLWYYKDEPAVTQDFNQANQLLEQAGWVKGSDGIRAKNGVKLELTACTTKRQYRIDTLTVVASWLQQIGIKVDVKPVPANPDFFGGWNEVSADTPCNLQRGNYDLAEFAWSYSPDPVISYNVYHSAGIPDNPPHSGQNTTRTNIPQVDKDYDTIKSSVDPVVIKAAMYDFQDQYYRNVIEIPLFNWREVWLVNPKLHNFVANPTQYSAEWNTGDWWVGQ